MILTTAKKWIPYWTVWDSAIAISAWSDVYKASLLYVGWTGNVTVTTSNGEEWVEFVAVPAWTLLPVLVTAVTAATATWLVLVA
jgi:hypothetical protein